MNTLSTAIRKNPLFQHFDEETLQALVACAQQRHYAPGAALILEGSLNAEVFFVLEGSVVVRHVPPTGGGPAADIIYLQAGEVIGELSLVDRGPRSASVIAHEATVALVWKADRLRDLCYEFPRFGLKLVFGVAELLCQRLRRANDSVAVLNDILWGSSS
jgi:CRP-like cAMP-binding protein